MDEPRKLGRLSAGNISKVLKEYIENLANVDSTEWRYIDVKSVKWHMMPHHYAHQESESVVRNVQDPLGHYSSTSQQYYSEPYDGAELQRLKDQLIDRERELIRSRNDLAEQRVANDKLLDEVAACRRIDAAQKHVKCAHDQDRVWLCEHRHGVVSNLHGDEVEVTYEMVDEEPLMQVYGANQFERRKLPPMGTWLETTVIMAEIDYKKVKELYAGSFDKFDLPDFDGVGIPGGPLTL